MSPLINLLPWRTLRRRYRLTLWGSMTIFGVLLIVLAALFWAKPLVLKSQLFEAQASILRKQEAALTAQLLHQQNRLKDHQQLLAKIRAAAAIKASISNWGSVINELAIQLPENSWLQSIRWQNESATVSGVAGDARELGQIESLLGGLPGAFRITPGEVRYEKHKGFAFTFILLAGGGGRAERS